MSNDNSGKVEEILNSSTMQTMSVKELERLEAYISSKVNEARIEADRRTLETVSAVLHGTGGKGKVTHEMVNESALGYIHNKLKMYEDRIRTLKNTKLDQLRKENHENT